MSETNEVYSDGVPLAGKERSLFSLKHKLISRTARHMQNLYLKFQKRSSAVSRSCYIPRVSYVHKKATQLHRSQSQTKEVILEEADTDLNPSVVEKYQNWVKEQGNSISKEVLQKMGKTETRDAFQSTQTTEMTKPQASKTFNQSQGFWKQTNLEKLKQLSSQLEEIPEIEKKEKQPRSRSEIKGRLVKVMQLLDQIQKQEQQQRAYYQEKHLCPMSKALSRHQREKLEQKARNGLSAQHYHPLYTQIEPNQPHATFLSRRNFKSSLWISFSAEESFRKGSPSEQRLESQPRQKKSRISTKVSSSKQSPSASRSPERKESLSPQRSTLKATITEERGSGGNISPTKMQKVKQFRREGETLPSEWGPILRKQDHLPNILFSRYITRKPLYNVEGNPHPSRFENRNLFPKVVGSNRRQVSTNARMSAHFDFSKMPARGSVMEPKQSYLPDYEPNYSYFKYPNPRKAHFSSEGFPRRTSESTDLLNKESIKKRATRRQLL